MSERYLDDFAVGQTFGSGRIVVDETRIKIFAAEFDPQPFHLDVEAARKSFSEDSQRAAGTRLPSACGCWLRAS
jgi:acyl dehydratase